MTAKEILRKCPYQFDNEEHEAHIIFAMEQYSESQNKELIENYNELLETHEYIKQQNIDVHLEWKQLNDKNKDLQKDIDEADHADYCMCRHCAPEFHKLMEKDDQANSNTYFPTDINKLK